MGVLPSSFEGALAMRAWPRQESIGQALAAMPRVQVDPGFVFRVQHVVFLV